MDSHYHEEGGALLEVNTHRTACPICSPKAEAPKAVEAPAAEIPAEVPVVPIRRPHRKHRPEAA